MSDGIMTAEADYVGHPHLDTKPGGITTIIFLVLLAAGVGVTPMLAKRRQCPKNIKN